MKLIYTKKKSDDNVSCYEVLVEYGHDNDRIAHTHRFRYNTEDATLAVIEKLKICRDMIYEHKTNEKDVLDYELLESEWLNDLVQLDEYQDDGYATMQIMSVTHWDVHGDEYDVSGWQ